MPLDSSDASAGKTDGSPSGPLVVGIGASAGGLEALKSFFGAITERTGLTFIVVVHLDPTHKSYMPELLARATTLTVEQARDRQMLEADHVYVIPPDRYLTLDQGLIHLREPVDRRALRGTIDQFFRSLAGDQRDRAVAIVLSGTGTEGTLGLKAIKAEGGLVMVQTPATASQAGMPTSAIATGLVDLVLPPDQMPAALASYTRHPDQPDIASPQTARGRHGPDGLDLVVGLLRALKKHDFRGYKLGTLKRRVARRMGLNSIATVPEYVEFLRTHPGEVDQLVKDLLITVTSFFRDAAAFEDLAKLVIAPLVRQPHADTPIRVWVPGCATGEEAYTIAILLAEQMELAQSHREFHIFATDVDEDSLQVARTGVYPENIEIDVSPQRLQRFFSPEDHRYRVAKPIRDAVTFAAQNLLKDPPLSKLDLVSCRNVLIYLEPDVQRRLIAMFHFALNRDGYLFLGSAESIGGHDELFTMASSRWRIYSRVGVRRRTDVHIPFEPPEPLPDSSTATRKKTSADVTAVAMHQLLERFAPVAVLINRTGDVLHSFGRIDRYLRLPTGSPSLDVLALARESLRPMLRAAIRDAASRRREVAVDVTAPVSGGKRGTHVRLIVTPVTGTRHRDLLLVMFEPIASTAAGSPRRLSAKQRNVVRTLETELRAAKREQQGLIDQLEGSNEDLKTANEEAVSMNEELQSTNEELESSKEELQSLNEELSTVNAQLREKVDELSAANDDLVNLFAATDIATVFVDAELRVTRFTPAASRLLNLIESDVGRPIAHLAHNLVNFDLTGNAAAVHRTGTAVEKAVQGRDGRDYIVRVVPYQREAKQPTGVVVTFIDVTIIRTAERELRISREYAQAIATLNQDALAGIPFGELGEKCTKTVAGTLRLEFVELLEHDTAADGLRRRASVGWDPIAIGTMIAPTAESPAAVAIRSGKSVTFSGLLADPRFAKATRIQERGLDSGLSVLVHHDGDPWGVLAAFAPAARSFAPDEIAFVEAVANTLGRALTRERTEDALKRLNQTLAERTKHLSLVYDVSRAISDAATWDEGLRLALSDVCTAEGWQTAYVYVVDRIHPNPLVPTVSYIEGTRFEPFHQATLASRFRPSESLPGLVYARGTTVWIDDPAELHERLRVRGDAARRVGLKAGVALPIRIGQETIGVWELFSDARHPPTGELTRLMDDLGVQFSRAFEREGTMQRVAALLWREQQELLHTLHDSLGQELTGLGLLSASASQRVKTTDRSLAGTLDEIKRSAARALDCVRDLSKGLFPVEVEPDGLASALRQLAATTENVSKIRCRVPDGTPVRLSDARVATELFRIAQEAVTNAVKHAHPHEIVIRLETDAGTTVLRIADDGVGMPEESAGGDGMGLKIMQYRAKSIGASLSIERGRQAGTVVTCTLRKGPTTGGNAAAKIR